MLDMLVNSFAHIISTSAPDTYHRPEFTGEAPCATQSWQAQMGDLEWKIKRCLKYVFLRWSCLSDLLTCAVEVESFASQSSSSRGLSFRRGWADRS
jgi:hypothetical protein